jgi:hypothetical protein
MKPTALDETIDRLSRVHLLQSLSDLLDQARHGVAVADAWATIHRTLDALPLDAASYALVRQRLTNIRGYLRDGEFGAALYEARLLRPVILNW